jgi:predicted aspartyl protease
MNRLRTQGSRLRVRCTLMLTMSAGCAAPVPPVPSPPSPRVVTVTADIVNNLVLVPVSVNGSASAPFILDTGASSSVIDQADVARFGLTPCAKTEADTGGGSVDASAIRHVTLELGGVKLPAVDIVAIDLSGVEAGLGTHVAGILGSEIFKQQVVEIDYAKQVVRLHDPADFHYAGTARPVPMVFRDDIPLVRPIFVTPAGDELDAKVEFDTGQAGALTLIRPFVIGAELMDPAHPGVSITTGSILAGKVPASVIRLKSIRLGDTSLKDVVANVTPNAEAAGVSGETMGLLGGEVLRRFRVFVDYSRSQAFLEPNGTVPEPFEFDMSGMSLAAQGATLHEYRVRSVIPGSPVAEAGVAVGDLLASVDGRPSQAMTLTEIRKLFREPTRQFDLELMRGAKGMAITIRTRRLI